ncbi:MAG: hypothetical protein J6B65_06580 [Paludibacteraceae bacterium]|nr:hypothetical protein [Paludibacteraceae bacterium]
MKKYLFLLLTIATILSCCENKSPISITIDNPTKQDYIINIDSAQFIKSNRQLVREYLSTKNTEEPVEFTLIHNTDTCTFDVEFCTGRHYSLYIDSTRYALYHHIDLSLDYYPICYKCYEDVFSGILVKEGIFKTK